jgi:endonuclease YncB( thermonuclease family)
LDTFKDGTKTYSNQDVRNACSKNTNLIDVESSGFDKYGRVLGKAYVDGFCLNELLLQEGYAKEYAGGRRETWTIDTLERILAAK